MAKKQASQVAMKETAAGKKVRDARAARLAARDTILLEIASTNLGLGTLETRNMDGLDFKEQAVWAIKHALRAAYEAGRASK